MGGITIPAVARQVGLLPAQFFTKSGSLTIPKQGYYRISAIGPGGSGAASNAIAFNTSCTGGSGGSFAEKIVSLQAGIVLNFTIPAPGGQATMNGNGGINGNDAAGPTTIQDSGGVIFSLSAPGGKGGIYLSGAGVNAGGAAPAIATGGDLNFAGGRGGNWTNNANTGGGTGGGACGSPYGNGGRGGDCTATGPVTSQHCTGGGAVGGYTGGDINSTIAMSVSGGGGCGGSAPVTTDIFNVGGINALGMLQVYSADSVVRYYGFDSNLDPMRSLSGGGSNAAALGGANGGSGAGSGGILGNTTHNIPGVCGGQGALSRNANNTPIDTTIGGGSGAIWLVASTVAISGRGGLGLIIVEQIG